MTHYTFTRIPICKSATNDQVVWLSAKRETIDYFQLEQLPKPRGYQPDPVTGAAFVVDIPTHPSRTGGKRYRIAYGLSPTSRKPLMASFKLGNGHTRETLCLIARHLDTLPRPWLWLCNEYGNHLGGMWSYANATV